MGEGGFEPPAPWSQTKNHTRLDHPPRELERLIKDSIILNNLSLILKTSTEISNIFSNFNFFYLRES